VHAQARDVLREFNVDVPVEARMGSLDLATQQLVVIARALSKPARVLILDEPTAALTEHEAQRLFGHLRTLRARGVSSIFVSHRLAEVFAVADRVLVMRDGRLRGDHLVGATTRHEVVTEMIGRAAVTQPVPGPDAPAQASGPARAATAAALEVEDLSVHDAEDPTRMRVQDLSFSLRHGEILGLFGLVGAGCGPAAYAIFGAWPGRVTGTIRRDGRAVTIRRTSDGIAAGIGLLAQDRRAALVLDHSIADNIVLASLPALGRRGWLDVDAKQLIARRYLSALQIKAPSVDTRVGTLSGGNQQKVQVARWLAAEAKVLLLVDPTRGVDVGARAEIYALLRRLASDGYALLLVSSEAEELVATCTRALVMRHGRLADEQHGAQITESQLLHAAAGM
jgi:D-xylose transport system ATP-binding protein